jgi:hypothetical protein
MRVAMSSEIIGRITRYLCLEWVIVRAKSAPSAAIE